MQDKETGSEWSHILGRAMSGKLKGTELTIIPSVMTNWERWKQDHPKTTVTTLSHVLSEFTTDFLKSDSHRFGLGLVRGRQARFWRFDNLLLNPVVNDTLGKSPLVVYFDLPSRTPVAWSRVVTNFAERKRQQQPKEELATSPTTPQANESTRAVAGLAQDAEVSNTVANNLKSPLSLTFRMTAQGVQDKETQSTWDLRNGVASRGPLQGTRLRALPAIVSFSSSWERFHPDSSEWKP